MSDRIRVICTYHEEWSTDWYELSGYLGQDIPDPHPMDMEAEMHADLYHDGPSLSDRFVGLMNDVEIR